MSTCQPPQHQCKNRYKHCPWNGLDVFRLWPLLLFIFSLNIWTANPKETCPCLQKHQTVETRVLHKNSQRVSHWATPSRRQGLKVLGLHSHHAAAQFLGTPLNDPEQPQKWLVQPSEFRFKDCWNISDQVHSTVPSYRTPPDPLAPFERLPSGPPPSSCQSAHLKVQPLG